MLLCMADSAQRNGVAIAGLRPHTTIGSCPQMGCLRRRCFAARYAGKLTDKS
jgi:hypothetical protein